MAIYTHFEAASPPPSDWDDAIATSYVANAGQITIINSGGTLTKAFGSFVLAGGFVASGTISTLQRTSGDSATLYESITGLTLDALAFVSAAAGDKLPLAFAGADTLNGNSTDEDLFGGDQNDALYGNGGDDDLHGEAGDDVMAGGPGDDNFYVSDPGDVVVEAPNEGDDLVYTALANYTLLANVDRLAFDTAISHTGTGNELDNILTGNAGADTLHGLEGDDAYTVGAGDIVIELPGEGTDRVQTSLANYSLPDNIENLTLSSGVGTGFGNALDNQIVVNGGATRVVYGLGGNDTLVSLGGSDVLDGGEGNDTLTAGSGTDIMLGGGGNDTFNIGIGNHTIADFVAGANTPDKINLASYKPGGVNFGQNIFTSMTDIFAHATQAGTDTVIDLGDGNSLTLMGVQRASLVATDFVGIVNLTGGPGADVLLGSGANELLDGAGDDDTAAFSQGLGSYTIQDFGSKIVISGPDGTDTLTGIEHLQFTDAVLNVVDDGNPLFDALYYYGRNPDVFHAGVDALGHYNAVGWHEGRDPNAFFDTSGYLAVNKDVAAAGINPLDHYHQSGWLEGRDPSAAFDTTFYLINNPDVAAAGVDPLAHYRYAGMAEGRSAYAAIGQTISGFDAQYYLLHNPDLAAAGIDPLFHFNAVGWQEGRDPNACFDTAGYLSHYADVAVAGINPLQHYEMIGWHEGRDASAHFDTVGYLAAYPDVAAAGMNPLQHFLQFGIYEGRQAVNDGVWG
jgi:Ca2+-binding RTX toxin-like protein